MNSLPKCLIVYLGTFLEFKDYCNYRLINKNFGKVNKRKNLSYWIKNNDPVVYLLNPKYKVKFACKYNNACLLVDVSDNDVYNHYKYFYKYQNHNLFKLYPVRASDSQCAKCLFYALKNNIYIEPSRVIYKMRYMSYGAIAGGYFEVFDLLEIRDLQHGQIITKCGIDVFSKYIEKYNLLIDASGVSALLMLGDVEIMEEFIFNKPEFKNFMNACKLIKNGKKMEAITSPPIVDYGSETLIFFTIGCLLNDVDIINFAIKYDDIDTNYKYGTRLAVKLNHCDVVKKLANGFNLNFYKLYKLAKTDEMREILFPNYIQSLTN